MRLLRSHPMLSLAGILVLSLLARQLLLEAGVTLRGIDAITGAVLLVVATAWLAATSRRDPLTVGVDLLVVLLGFALILDVASLASLAAYALLAVVVVSIVVGLLRGRAPREPLDAVGVDEAAPDTPVSPHRTGS